MKNYKVIAENEFIEMEVGVNTLEEAQETFNTFMEGDYYRIVAVDIEKSEVLAECYRSHKSGGTETVLWVAD